MCVCNGPLAIAHVLVETTGRPKRESMGNRERHDSNENEKCYMRKAAGNWCPRAVADDAAVLH